MRLWTFVTVALLLPLLEGAFHPQYAGAVPAGTTVPRDRMIAKRVRGAIRNDPFLALATPAVKVTSRGGVVRLSGKVGTDKERSSIAFKARQIAGAGSVDDRVTVGNHVTGTAR